MSNEIEVLINFIKEFHPFYAGCDLKNCDYWELTRMAQEITNEF